MINSAVYATSCARKVQQEEEEETLQLEHFTLLSKVRCSNETHSFEHLRTRNDKCSFLVSTRNERGSDGLL